MTVEVPSQITEVELQYPFTVQHDDVTIVAPKQDSNGQLLV